MKKYVCIIAQLAFSTLLASPADSLNSRMADLGKAYEVAGYHGVVLLADRNGILGTTSFGVADQQSMRKNNLSTLFKTESTGKLFTATAILQLVEQGKLDLQKSVADYLPDSGLRNAEKMSLHYLLTHQTGLTAPWEKEGFEFREYSKDEWWSFIVGNPVAFDEPGTGVYYSSSAYEILAAIIEKVSGLSFEAYCRDNLFLPAGMTHTFYRMDTLQLSKVGAKPYRWTGENSYYQFPLITFTAGGAGGWFSTANDFYKFALALMGEKLISKASLDLLMPQHVELFPGHYGYGMQIIADRILPGKTVYGHNGGGMGYGADLFFEPQSGVVVVGMTNMYGNSTMVSGNFMKLAWGSEPDWPAMDSRRILFDLIEQEGLDTFATEYEMFCEKAGIKDLDERLLITMGDNYQLLERNSDYGRYFEILSTILPDNTMVWLKLGDIAAEAKNTDLARTNYQKALSLAETKDTYWLPLVREKLGTL